MFCLRSSVAVVIAVGVLGTRSARAENAAPAPRRLTLAGAIEIALSGNPQLAIDTEVIAAADARTRSDATLRLPLLSVRSNVMFWNRVIEADLGAEGKVIVRDRITGTVDVQVSQPVTGAFAIGTLVARDRATADASRAQRDARRIEIAYQAAESYLAALQARTLGEIAATTLQQLDADLQHARTLVQGGMLQRVDVLRLEAEHARVEQQRLAAQTDALAARRRLGHLLGLPDGGELALADVDTAPPALALSEDEAVARARAGRAELRAAAATRRAAELGISVARSSYYPVVSLVGVYSREVNPGLLDSPDSAYLGVSVDWNLWDWGKRGADVDASRAAHRQARIEASALNDQIAVDTRARWQAARLAQATLEVTDRGLAAAAEAQRLQAARFAQGAATTTELVDAEAALATARSQAANARYQYLVAWMALHREIGLLPVPAEAAR